MSQHCCFGHFDLHPESPERAQDTNYHDLYSSINHINISTMLSRERMPALLLFFIKHWQDECSLQSNGNAENEMHYPAWHYRVSQDSMLSDELDDRIIFAVVNLDTEEWTSCGKQVDTCWQIFLRNSIGEKYSYKPIIKCH